MREQNLDADVTFEPDDRLERETGGARFDPDPGVAGTTRGAARSGNGRSVVTILRELTTESRDLMQLELELAKTEMREKLGVYERNMGAIAVGGALLLATLLMLVIALNRGLTALLEGWMSLEVAVWLAPLILAVVLGGIGWSMIQKGLAAIRGAGVTPHRTMETLKDDKRWAERKVKHEA